MFNLMIKKLGTALIVAASLFANSSWAATLSFTPSTNTATVGNSVAIDVVISGLTNTQDLSAFDFNINFDSSVLGFASYTLGSGLGNLAAFEAFDTSAGVSGSKINLSEVSFLSDFSAQAGTFTLATLTFNGLSGGNSSLSFSDVTLGDAFGSPLAASLSTGSVSIAAAVPEADTYALMLAGLGLIGFMRRRNV